MLSEEKLMTLPTIQREYWRKAQEFVRTNQTEWIPISLGMLEYEEWTKYFRAKNWRPFGIRMVEQGRCTVFLVPAQWPQWFENTPPPPVDNYSADF